MVERGNSVKHTTLHLLGKEIDYENNVKILT